MAVSILFLVQDVSIAPKFGETDFWKIVSELEEFSEKGRSLNFGAMGPMLEGYRSVTILQGANTRKVDMCGSAI